MREREEHVQWHVGEYDRVRFGESTKYKTLIYPLFGTFAMGRVQLDSGKSGELAL